MENDKIWILWSLRDREVISYHRTEAGAQAARKQYRESYADDPYVKSAPLED